MREKLFMFCLHQMQIVCERVGGRVTTTVALERIVIAVIAHVDVVHDLVGERNSAMVAYKCVQLVLLVLMVSGGYGGRRRRLLRVLLLVVHG